VTKKLNPTITIEFPAEAANKIANFKTGTGAAEWDNILRGFENVLGALPIDVKTANVPGNVSLLTKIHASAGR
jgi:hypothetical protein